MAILQIAQIASQWRVAPAPALRIRCQFLQPAQFIAIHNERVDPRRLQLGGSEIPVAEYMTRLELVDCEVFVFVVLKLVCAHRRIRTDHESNALASDAFQSLI